MQIGTRGTAVQKSVRAANIAMSIGRMPCMGVR